MGDLATTHFVNQVVYKVEIDTYIDQKKFFDQNIIDEIVVETAY